MLGALLFLVLPTDDSPAPGVETSLTRVSMRISGDGVGRSVRADRVTRRTAGDGVRKRVDT
ncbi:hypothetical protein [Capsulimonas sp.]|uniref:hypothetical protein n=1 Tax=Capsulimonas sp. TaxID=2494211 RepID=UPI003266BA00